ncbi:MAG: hypothetical protein K9M45_04490, partial [Kiritimatiellales bacterium]|nr:hypothetical protein [Kiritimatiellales bacterium]
HTTITDVAYRDQHGEIKPKSILFRKHFWGKRFSTAFWLMGRPPFQMGGNEPESSFLTVWFVEGVNDVDAGSDFLRQGVDLNTYAAFTTVSGGMRWSNTSFVASGTRENPVVNTPGIRLALGYCLLLDIPLRPKGWHYRDPIQTIVDRIDKEVEFFHGAELLSYWRAAEWGVNAESEDVTVGGYRHPDGTKAVMLVLNSGEGPVDAAIAVNGKKLIGTDKWNCTDLETGKNITTHNNQVMVPTPAHEVRFILVSQ